MCQPVSEFHARFGGRDAGKSAKMSHIFADSQQHSFFANRLLVSAACQ